jgi:dihydrofolate synthase/folylpolyglutamate synthase
VSTVKQIADAMAYLDSHASYDRTGRVEDPSIARMVELCAAMGDPQHAAPVIHITGTNGKGSTSQIVTRLLQAHGLSVGTYTSPHLERINERMAYDGEPIGDDELAEQIAGIADLELVTGVRPTYFEIVTAAAFRWFAERAVDVAVVEVGMLGRWDATNVVEADVAVVTNVRLDHMEFAGPTRAHIAREKAGIIKPSSVLVAGENDPDLLPILLAEGPRRAVVRGEDFDTIDNQLAVGGRLLTVRTPRGLYADVFLPLHGAHQGDNASVSVTAVEEFFGQPVDPDVLAEAFARVRMPGRFEVLDHQPLVVVDGAHNPDGADVCAQVFFDDFQPAGRRSLVVGCLRGRDPLLLLEALRADEFDTVFACTAPSPRGLPGHDVAVALKAMGCDDVVVLDSVEAACDRALRDVEADDAILVAGSLYVVGTARPYLRSRLR